MRAPGVPGFELRRPDNQKKPTLREMRLQKLAALGYGRPHARSTLSIAFREFSNEIWLLGGCRWEP